MKKINKGIARSLAALIAALVIVPSAFAVSAAPNDENGGDGENGAAAVETIPTDEKTDLDEPNKGKDAEGESDGENNNGVTDSNVKPVEIRDGGNILAVWFGKALKWISEATGSYIIGIFLIALAAKVILFPLSIKQQKNSQKMAKLSPKIKAIQKKYAGRDDRSTQMKMQEEIQKLYTEEQFNPMGGCLPMFLQLPIVLALYTAITSPLSSMLGHTKETLAVLGQELAQNTPALAGKVLSQADAVSKIAPAGLDENIIQFYEQFKFLNINLMDMPNWTSLLIIVPALVFLSSFFSTKIIRKFTYNPSGGAQQDMSMKFMDWTMPLMILWFSFQVPALVGVYWVFQNIISIGQQFALYKLFPVKEPTPEEIREAELLMKGKKPKKTAESADIAEKNQTKPAISKAALKKKKEKSPFIYAKKGIDGKYLERIRAKGVKPKAKKRL